MARKPNPPEVDLEKCVSCDRCVEVCPGFVLEMKEEKAFVIRPEWCIECGHCGAVCPTEAILQGGSFGKKEGVSSPGAKVSPEMLRFLLRERRSVRCYSKEPVPREAIEKILDVGRYAPTGGNSQNVHYVVLTSPDEIARLRGMALNFYEKIFSRVRSGFGSLILSMVAGRKTVEYLKEALPKVEYFRSKMKEGDDPLLHHAPVVMVTHAESWDPSSAFNCAVALYHCSLMAHTLGLGCCFNGFLESAMNHSGKMKRWLGIPSDHRCYATMAFGYPDVKYERFVDRDSPKATWR